MKHEVLVSVNEFPEHLRVQIDMNRAVKKNKHSSVVFSRVDMEFPLIFTPLPELGFEPTRHLHV